MNEIIDFSKVKSISINKTRIPKEYDEVECVSSVLPGGKNTSSLYVDLGVAGVNGCRIRGSINSTDADHSLYGARSWWQQSRFGFTTDSHIANTFAFMHGTGDSDIFRFTGDTNIHFIDDNCSKLGYCLIDNREPIKLNHPSDVTSRTLWLFNDNCAAQPSDYGGACTIYNAEFYKNQILVSYPIPCKRRADEVVGFYDIVQNKFLTATVKKGTAKLEAGRVLSPDIVQFKIGGIPLWTKPDTTLV